MKSLDSTLLKKFLRLAAESLEGDWLLVGGTLLPAVGLNVRTTVDIDLVGLGKKEAAQGLELMRLTEKLGLSVETINQTASFFLNKIDYKKQDLLLLTEGKKARIYRPSLLLYWQLKLPRMTESDYTDCIHYFHYCQKQDKKTPKETLLKAIVKQEKKSPTAEKMQRLTSLKSLLD